jgi:hypothetical protein
MALEVPRGEEQDLWESVGRKMPPPLRIGMPLTPPSYALVEDIATSVTTLSS